MGKKYAIAGLVLSIVGTVFGLLGATGIFAILGLPVAIVGLVLSVIGGKKLAEEEQPKGMATAGLVLGIISVVITGISFLTCGLCVICAGGTAAGVSSLLG